MRKVLAWIEGLVVEVVGRVACRKTGEARLVNLHCLHG